MTGFAYTSVEARQAIQEVLEQVGAQCRDKAYRADADVDITYHLGQDCGVSLALAALAERFGFPPPVILPERVVGRAQVPGRAA